MNYRHAYHAGNFADVVKHLAEVAILSHLAKKDAPFAVIDSHAGRGRYDLASEEARKTGEAAAGIEKLARIVRAAIARPLSRPGRGKRRRLLSRLAPDRGPDAAGRRTVWSRSKSIPRKRPCCGQVLAPWRKARAEEGDGYARLLALLPPPERRGLVLIDPPFEATDEFENAGPRFARSAFADSPPAFI